MKKYNILTAKDALELLEPIPEEQFITGDYWDGKNGCCTVGHLRRLLSPDKSDYNYAHHSNAIVSNFSNKVAAFIRETTTYFGGVVTVNDRTLISKWNDPTSKQRVVHLFKDMAEWEAKNTL